MATKGKPKAKDKGMKARPAAEAPPAEALAPKATAKAPAAKGRAKAKAR